MTAVEGVADQSAGERTTHKTYLWLGAATTILAVLLGVSVLHGDIGPALVPGAGLLLATVRLIQLRRRGYLGKALTSKRYRTGAIIAALIGIAFCVLSARYAIEEHALPALVFGVLGAGGGVLLAAIAYLNSRLIQDAAAAIDLEPARMICAQVRGLWIGDDPPGALVLTATRVVQLRVSAGASFEEASVPLGQITDIDADYRRGMVVIHGTGTTLAVHRAPPVQVHALVEELRRAGLRTGG